MSRDDKISRMDHRPSSLLTGTHRSVLAGEKKASHESKMRERIRDRVYAGLRHDGVLLLNELPADERRKIFRGWEKGWADKELDPRPQGMLLQSEEVEQTVAFGEDPETAADAAEVERAYLRAGVTNLLAFLYVGIAEGDLGDFGEILEEAIRKGANERHMTLKEFEFEAELGGTHVLTPEAIAEKVRQGDGGDLTFREVMFAIEEGELDPSEAEEIIKRFRQFFDQVDELTENMEGGEE